MGGIVQKDETWWPPQESRHHGCKCGQYLLFRHAFKLALRGRLNLAFEIIGGVRETEETLYAAVGEEIRRGEIRQGLWAKALSEEGYDEQRARARYLKLRVRSLRKEIAEAAYHEQVRAREEEKR